MPKEKPNQGNTEETVVEETPPTPETPQEPVKEEPKPTPTLEPKETPSVQRETEETLIDIGGDKVPIDELRNGYMRQKDYTQKTQDLAEKSKSIDNLMGKWSKIESAFKPEIPIESEEPHPSLRQEDVEKLVDEKLAEKERRATVDREVDNCTKEFNGGDGRPKYNDSEIWKWQQENKKTYLSPKEAYEARYKNELIDWEVQQRLKKAGTSVQSERVSSGGEVNIPQEKKVFIKKGANGKFEDDPEARIAAIRESMDNLDREI